MAFVLDSETAAFIKVAGLLAPTLMLPQTGLITFGQEKPTVRPEIEKWLRGRVEIMTAGIEKCPKWFQRRLAEFDPNLRLRWDFYNKHWIVEHLSFMDGYFHACGIWNQPLGEPLIEALRKGDLRKKSPDEHIKENRDACEQQQKRNDHNVDEQLGEAIDGMTNRQVREFVEASEAMATGEEIVPMGADAEFMQRLHDKNVELQTKGIEVPADSQQAINPGMKPGTYVRQRREN